MIVILLAFASSVSAERAGSVLQEEVGARTAGLGGAITALGDDLSSLHANPAGLAFTDYNEIHFDAGRHQSDPEGLQDDLSLAIATSVPVGRKATVALAARGYEADNENDGLIHLGGARLLRPDLAIGFGAKYLRSEIPRDRYEGIFGDVGIRYNSARRGVVLGASVRNVTFTERLKSGAALVDFPLTYSAGISYGRLRSTAHYYNLSLDAVKIEGRDIALRAGAEYWIANLVAVRAGWNGSDRNRWRGGMSLSFHGVLADLTVAPSNGSFDNAEIHGSIRMTFGEGRKR